MPLVISIFIVFAAVSRISAQTNSPEILNLKDFGVVGDGVADDTASLQKAIKASAGKILFIPKPPVKYKTNPLWLVSNLKIIFAPGTVIEANKGYKGVKWLPGNKGALAGCVFQIQNLDNVFIEDHHIDYPHQWRAIGWVQGELYTVVYEDRKDKDGDYYHFVTLWKATKREKLIYEENT